MIVLDKMRRVWLEKQLDYSGKDAVWNAIGHLIRVAEIAYGITEYADLQYDPCNPNHTTICTDDLRELNEAVQVLKKEFSK